MKDHQAVDVAVVIERTANPNQWEAWRFKLLEVVPDQGSFGATPRCLHNDGKVSRWLYPGFNVALFAVSTVAFLLLLKSARKHGSLVQSGE